jgi:hypothetical protein
MKQAFLYKIILAITMLSIPPNPALAIGKGIGLAIHIKKAPQGGLGQLSLGWSTTLVVSKLP